LGGKGDEVRDDRPDLKAQLRDLKLIAEGMTSELATVNGEISVTKARLLPDEERARLAQLARDIRDDNLPDVDADVPLTPCPDWCESTRCENGEGKYHEGAITTVEGVNWVDGTASETRKKADVYAYIDEGRPVLNIYADTDLDGDGARALAAGLLGAADLWEQLGGAR
jgi:hypothetical protein